MKFDLEYGFNNQSLPKFEKYKLEVINDIKYVVPEVSSGYSLISFEDYEENNKPLIDFINLGKLSLENEEDTDKLLIDYVNEYGLLGLIHNLPVNRYYTLDKNKLYYRNEKYYEQVDQIVSYAQTLYNILKELKKEDSEYIDYSLIAKLESNHIRTNLKYDGVEIHIRSLKEYIDENFKLFAILEKKYLKLCKHCGKAFTAPNPKTEYDTFSCKNQENVYKSRAKASSNMTITDEGICVKNIIS